MPLARLPKTFGVEELKKGFFPHKFNRDENQNYVGVLPDRKFFDAEMMSSEKKKEFELWYERRKNQPFDFRTEIYEYCK